MADPSLYLASQQEVHLQCLACAMGWEMEKASLRHLAIPAN